MLAPKQVFSLLASNLLCDNSRGVNVIPSSDHDSCASAIGTTKAMARIPRLRCPIEFPAIGVEYMSALKPHHSFTGTVAIRADSACSVGALVEVGNFVLLVVGLGRVGVPARGGRWGGFGVLWII